MRIYTISVKHFVFYSTCNGLYTGRWDSIGGNGHEIQSRRLVNYTGNVSYRIYYTYHCAISIFKSSIIKYI